MLSIGTKKYRNLQEQVAYNTECIKKLDDYLDGITIEDKLVVIESDSGTFTDEELVILSGPLAFISDGSKVWMKQSENLTQFVYKAIDIVATEVGSAYFNIGGTKITVDRSTGAYNTSTEVIITTYSKSQIDSIVANIMALKADKTELTSGLALKANISGQAFTGGISAPSIIENMNGYGFTPNPDLATNGFGLNYVGAVKNGNKVTFAVAGTFIPNSSTVVNPSLGAITFPTAIGQQLYPDTLGALSNQYVSFFNSANTSVSKNVRTTKTGGGNNGVSFQFFSMSSGFVLDTPYSFRFEVTFLLSDSLAS